MATLLLRLSGPMQSWGTQSRFSVRDTGREPSKSGVIGLLCAALGWQRSKPVGDLDRLLMGVRVDREGVMKMDWHTALDVAKASGAVPRRPKDPKFTVTSRRYYLSDADFLVGLEGEDAGLLEQLHDHLRRPVWQLFLGRKSFVPGRPVWIPNGLKDEPVREALEAYPWLARTPAEKRRELDQLQRDQVELRLAIEVRFEEAAGFSEKRPLEVRQDRLRSDFVKRDFATRHVATYFVPLKPDMVKLEGEWWEEEVYPCTSQG